MKKLATLLVLSIISAFALAGYKLFLVATHPIKYTEQILTYSNQYNLSPELVASVINAESSFNQFAISHKNARGLMQLKLNTANYLNELHNREKFYDELELMDININIEYGCMYLRYLIDKFDDVYTSLAAYNAGETRVRTWLNDSQYSFDKKTLHTIPYNETKNYIKKIKNNLNYYKQIFYNN